MNPELPKDERAALESSLTALLLGELPHEQAAALHQKLAQDAELAKLYERLKLAINLVRETVASPAAETATQPVPLRLSDQRRQKLLQQSKTVAPREFVPPRWRAKSWLVPVGIAAALVAVMGVTFVPYFFNAKTRSLGSSFGTWSLSESASTVPASPVALESPIEVARLAATEARRNVATKELSREVGELAPPAAVPAAARPAGSVIVLPNANELPSVATTPAAAEGAQHGFDVSGTTKGLFDDSQGLAGGMMGGGRGSDGGVRGDASVKATPETSSEAGATELRVFRLSNGDPSETAHQLSRLFPEPTASNSGSQAPMTPFLSRGGSGGREISSSTAANVSDPTEKKDRVLAVPDPRTSSVIVTAPKNLMPQIADMVTELDSDKGRKETVGFYDLQNTDPQDVYNNLQAQFKRSNVRAQNDNQTTLLAQNSPVYQRLRNNTQTTSGGTSAGFGGGGFGGRTSPSSTTPGAGIPERQYPNNSTIGDAYFSLDPETRRVANIEAPPPAAVPPSSVTAEPAQETLGKAVVNYSVSGPTPAPAKPALLDQSSVVAGVPLQAPAYNKGAGDLTAGLRTAVPSQPAADAGIAGEALQKSEVPGLVTSNQKDQNALGFEFYAGKSRNGRLGGQAGTTPSGTDQALIQGQEHMLLPPSEPAATPNGTVPLAIKLPAPAFKGMPSDVPVLGNVPVAGGLFPTTPGAAGANVEANSGAFVTGQTKDDLSTLGVARGQTEGRAKSVAWPDYDTDGPLDKIASGGKAGRPDTGNTHVYNLDVVGYVNVPLTATNAIAGFPAEPSTAERNTYNRKLSELSTDASGALRPARSPIVLPGAPSETGLVLNEGDARDKKQIAAGARQLKVEEKPKSVDFFAKLDTVANGVEKLHEDLQIANSTAAPNAPKKETTIETLGRLERLRTGGEVKREPDEKLPAGMVDLRSAKLDQVLDIYSVLANRQVLRPATLPASTITLSLTTLLTKQEAIQALDSVLALNGITMVKTGDKLVKALPENQAINAGARFDTNSAMLLPDSGQYVTHVVQLSHAKPSDVVPALQPLLKAPNSILPIDSSRILVLRDSRENVNRMLEKIAQVDVAEGKEDSTPPAAPKPTAPAPVPQPEVQTADNAFSTFSLNVSDVSFKLAAASLEKGIMPEPATVRSEEFINAFDYRDSEPPPGVPVAFAWERAQYPFAQNRDLLRFSVKTAALGRQPGRPLNIVLLLDNSGSMERADRVRIIHEALLVLASQLQPQDKFSVVTFARTAHLWVDGVPGNQAAQVAEEVSGLTPQGGTNLEDAMNLAYQTALRHYLANGINRVVLLTDGAANLGNVEPEALKQKVEANRKQGIALDCFGIGWEGYNDDLLEVLSRNGDGRYAFLNTPEEVASEFAAKLAGALQVAASDVKVQVEFNPDRVTAYRQIGYARHQLTKEQFRDNTVNAAQIGAAEAGNALYAVEVNPAGTGQLCTVRVRFRIPGTTDYREHAWDVPFTGNAVLLEQASPAMRLAATGSAFSEWLASSPYAAEVTPDRLLSYLSGVPEVYGADARPKKLEWMIRQAKSIAGK